MFNGGSMDKSLLEWLSVIRLWVKVPVLVEMLWLVDFEVCCEAETLSLTLNYNSSPTKQFEYSD